MREPVWRTQSGRIANGLRAAVIHRRVPLLRLLSVCSVISFLALSGLPAHAQGSDSQIRYSIESKKAVKSLLLDIVRAGDRLVVAGDRGHILYSDDGGATWQQAKVPTRQMLTAVYFVDDTHGWAVGHDALILATEDGGQTWTRQYEEREREAPLLDVWFENRQHGIAVGAYGALLETTDGGKTWHDIADRLDNEDGFHLNAIAAIPGGGVFIVGEMGGMFRSADQGMTWERVESPYEGSLFGVIGSGEPGGVIAFGLRGHLFRSADFGNSWEQVELNEVNGGLLESGLADGARLPDGRLAVVGHGGIVLISDDQGRSFDVHARSDRLSLAGVTSDSKGNLILVGQGGVRVASPMGADQAQSN